MMMSDNGHWSRLAETVPNFLEAGSRRCWLLRWPNDGSPVTLVMQQEISAKHRREAKVASDNNSNCSLPILAGELEVVYEARFPLSFYNMLPSLREDDVSYSNMSLVEMFP